MKDAEGNLQLNKLIVSTLMISESHVTFMFAAGATQRLYESLRRQHLSQHPGNLEKAQEQDRKKKYRARRERVSQLNYYT